jgi:plastocyanin
VTPVRTVVRGAAVAAVAGLLGAGAAGGVALAAPMTGSGNMGSGNMGSGSMDSAGMVAQMKAASAAAASARPTSASTIVIHNFAFAPGSIKVRPGQKVRVVNRDSVAHTVTSTSGKFNTGDVGPGKTMTFTAPAKAGRYPYRCNIHQYMTGVLVVS